jgi:hypothetical protein
MINAMNFGKSGNLAQGKAGNPGLMMKEKDPKGKSKGNVPKPSKAPMASKKAQQPKVPSAKKKNNLTTYANGKKTRF